MNIPDEEFYELEKELAALRASLTALSAEKAQWNAIADVEPPDDTYCLVWRKWPGRIDVCKCVLRQLPRVTWEGLYGWEPTHWMPLPASPNETDAERASTSDVPSGHQATISQLRQELGEVSRRLLDLQAELDELKKAK